MSQMDLNDIEKDLAQTEAISHNYLTGAYVRFGIRWSIVIIIYLLLWNSFSWIHWTLLFTLPLSIYSLYRLVTTQDRLNDQFKDVRAALEEARKFSVEKDEQ